MKSLERRSNVNKHFVNFRLNIGAFYEITVLPRTISEYIWAECSTVTAMQILFRAVRDYVRLYQ